MNKIIKLVAIVIILAAIFYVGFYYGEEKAIAPGLNNDNQPSGVNQPINEKVSLMLDFGNGEIKTFTDLDFTENQNVFDLLKQVTEKNNIELLYKDYGGDLGVFIESIGGVKNNNDSWWQYWVNNKYSEIGASNYIIQLGDVIEFKFVKGQIKF